ncbi:CaiB/BaiF CoA transferase family protein [Mycobacterium montefiorense]|uniref:CaiB/BaiF CoA transferase family protein n=1 Tax=Mycobacterium montefiorense TaxID=154654 RepID=UPI0021DD7B1A|nr:CaiB/BaiF CoA-transferase family protein [Mycobacterium montefiorense]MCV7427485.1 CoA transferase [Mycobacterium montefiorense]GLE54305.1 CoA transferase [Mycobacterium montefiorense]
MTLPLEGVRVIDFTRVLAGPHCTKHLLDLGAEVIKIEPPQGDISRFAFPRQDEISGYYAQQNAGKRNLSIDLNVPQAREAVLRLCDTADIIVENFRPGALASFGLDYDSVAARNPAVVYASISGYGQTGPWRSRMAYAPTVQAEVGFTQNTLQQFGVDGADRRSDALSHGDIYAGLHGTIAVLAALQSRRVTGEGQYIDVAMAAVLTSLNERVHYDLSDAELGAETPILGATDCAFFTSPEGHQFVTPMSLVGSMSFPFYLHAMRRADLADDPRFRTAELRRQNFETLHAIVQTWIYTFDSMDSLDAQLDEAKIATGQLHDIVEFSETEWAKGWGVTREVSDRHGGTITIPAPPWHFSGHGGTLAAQLPARQGEHNEEILKEIGLTADEIQALVKTGALIEPARESNDNPV